MLLGVQLALNLDPLEKCKTIDFRMMTTSFYSKFPLILATTVLLSACVTNKTVHDKDEGFNVTDAFTHTFSAPEGAICEASRRALLSQGYVIVEATSTFVRGRRKFQPDSEVHLEIEFSVVCASDNVGGNTTSVFANAVRDRYSVKKSSNSASLGVGGLGSVSLPFGSSDDSLVKVGSETVSTGKVYERFFKLVERYLDDTWAGEEEYAETEKEKAELMAPKPAPAKPAASTEPAPASQPAIQSTTTPAVQRTTPLSIQTDVPVASQAIASTLGIE